MKSIRTGLALLLAALLLCAGCSAAPRDEPRLRLACSTYPVYLLACAVSAGAPGVSVSRLQTGQVSCLHDYTLTVGDMRALELADLILLNGAGLEEFLSSALRQTSAPAVDCSAGVDLLEGEGHDHAGHSRDHDDHEDEDDGHGHDDGHDGHGAAPDPHIWMDPANAALMAQNIAAALSRADPDYAALYADNARAVEAALRDARSTWADALSGLAHPYLITFHDGFSYFARAFGLTLLFALEEEEGATASARDIRTAADLVSQYGLPAVFAERNGSGAAARAVQGETGCAVYTLSMLMDGPDAEAGASALDILNALYLSSMEENIQTLLEVLQ